MKSEAAAGESYSPPIEGEPVYNLMEAVEVIGRTTGIIYAPKNRQLLEEFGAKTGGREWRIPQSALIRIGWLQEDGSSTNPKKSGNSPALKKNALERELQEFRDDFENINAENESFRRRAEVAEARIADKDAEIARLNETIQALINKQ